MNVVESLRARYPKLHPLIFHRSVEKAKTSGELFDILEDVPEKFPIIWNEDVKRWETTSDLFQMGSIDKLQDML